MISSWKHVTRRRSLGLGVVLLMVLLAACGGSGGASSTGSTPTPKPPTPTPTPTVATANMKTYTGTNFSISYPATWQESASGNQVTFADALVTKDIMTIVTVPNPAGAQSASSLADATMPAVEKVMLTNSQPATVAPTVTVGGESWVQRSATGDLALTDPGTQGTMFLLVDNHPANSANTQAYEIYYYGPTSTFSQSNTLAFQPMLQSFKFAS
jgi:hypothetical protein